MSQAQRQEQPPPYDPADNTFISLKFPVHEILTTTEIAALKTAPKIHHDETITIKLRMDEYTSYFIKDAKTGTYKDGVVEPETGRKEWLKRRYLEQEDPRSEFSKRVRASTAVSSMDELRGNTVFL